MVCGGVGFLLGVVGFVVGGGGVGRCVWCVYIFPPAPRKNSDFKLLTFSPHRAIMVVLKINGERRILG